MNPYQSKHVTRRKVKLDGIEFDSKREAKRYQELRMLERAGLISNLRTQVRYELIPAQYEESDEVYRKGKHRGEKKPGKLIERSLDYVADFVYIENGNEIVEDVKGYKSGKYNPYAIFVIKRKLMYYVYKIKIREVS